MKKTVPVRDAVWLAIATDAVGGSAPLVAELCIHLSLSKGRSGTFEEPYLVACIENGFQRVNAFRCSL
jgi:hypothetical protein